MTREHISLFDTTLRDGQQTPGIDFSLDDKLTDEGADCRTLNFVKQLRRDMTDVERKLWFALRDRRFEQFKFRRQVPIGKYIVDFVCLERRLIVELDGSQHEGSLHDAKRDAWLRTQNFRVLRFWNIDINQALD